MNNLDTPPARSCIELSLTVESGVIVKSGGRVSSPRKLDAATEDNERYFTLRGHIGRQIDEHTVQLVIDAVLAGPEPGQVDEIPWR